MTDFAYELKILEEWKGFLEQIAQGFF